MKKFLTIAGSDSSGGAGIQADLKTAAAHGVYGMSVITALTAQNTTGVFGVSSVSGEFVKAQAKAVFEDIFPDSVKIGMVFSQEIINATAEILSEYKPPHIVCDTVMVATSGSPLLEKSAEKALTERLFPLAEIITPNIPEAEILSGMSISNRSEMERAGIVISKKFGCSVLVKGGHLSDTADDILFENGEASEVFGGVHIDNPNTHGTGCTLSSAIACNLALGYSLRDSVKNAKDYVAGAIAYGLDLGKGSGPLNHMYRI